MFLILSADCLGNVSEAGVNSFIHLRKNNYFRFRKILCKTQIAVKRVLLAITSMPNNDNTNVIQIRCISHSFLLKD